MRGLQTLQIGRQWCTLANAAHGRKKAANLVETNGKFFISTSSSQKFDTERGQEEERVNMGAEGEEMVSVQFRGNDITVPRGAVLRTALLQHGLTPHSERAVVINCRCFLRLLKLNLGYKENSPGNWTVRWVRILIDGVFNSRGLATCGTCAVQIEGNVIPTMLGVKEAFRLKLPPHGHRQNSNLRLACQVRLDGDVKVTKYDKFWGQGSIPLGPTSASDSVTPLGKVEFLLDFEKKTKNN